MLTYVQIRNNNKKRLKLILISAKMISIKHTFPFFPEHFDTSDLIWVQHNLKLCLEVHKFSIPVEQGVQIVKVTN